MKTAIFGHKKPDTDSVMSAIGLSYLKNKLGARTEARVLGTVNKETKYALKYFGLDEPKFLNDVKLQIRDINYHKNFFIKETDSIYKGYQMMLQEGQTGLPVAHANNNFAGLITIKDLSYNIINKDNNHLDTSYANIIEVLGGEEVLKFDEEIKGELLVASYRSTTFMNNVPLNKNMILIVGDRHSIIEYAVISGVKLVIVIGNGEIKEKHLEIAKMNKVNVIRISQDTYHAARLIPLTNYIKTMIRSYNPTKFVNTDYVDDVIDINNKLKHTNYPIVDVKNKCLGLLRITDLSEKNPKKVILVDHNEPLQSAEGLSEANVLEIIDHHNLGSITTSAPVNFRNMAVGSTCTIVYTLYKEREVEIPKEIAGALLSGILSDTLILKSPTATAIDVEAIMELSTIAGVNYKKYGMDMLKAGTSLEGMSIHDVIYNDYKLFTVDNKTFAIGQFFTINFDEIKDHIDEYIEALDELCEANNYSLACLYVTDIIKQGSYVIYNSRAKETVALAHEIKDISEGYFIDGIISRKKHIVPNMMEIFEN